MRHSFPFACCFQTKSAVSSCQCTSIWYPTGNFMTMLAHPFCARICSLNIHHKSWQSKICSMQQKRLPEVCLLPSQRVEILLISDGHQAKKKSEEAKLLFPSAQFLCPGVALSIKFLFTENRSMHELTFSDSRSSSPDARPTEEPKARGRSRRRSIDKPNQESQELLTESLDDLFASQATVPSSTEDHAIMLEAASPLPLGGGGRATRMRKSDSDVHFLQCSDAITGAQN